MTPAERARRERVAQGLPERIQDQDVLDKIAAILLDGTGAAGEDGDGRAP